LAHKVVYYISLLVSKFIWGLIR